MNVLLVNSTCKRGGVTRFMLLLRDALIRLGHRCELFFFEGGTQAEQLRGDPMAHFGSLADCMRLIHRQRIDVVHANNVDWAMGISAVRQLGARLILTAHRARRPAWTYGWTRANCDGFVAVSQSVRDELQPHTDMRIDVLENGVDIELFAPAEQPSTWPPIVAWVGRTGSAIKRMDKLASIAPALRDAGVRLWVIDQHPVERRRTAFPRSADVLEACAEVWRDERYERMPTIYQDVAASGGCVLSTSDAEGLGLALIEAQACGCCVVGPDVPGVRDAVSIEHGGVLYPFDLAGDRLAQLVLDVLRDRERLRLRQREVAAHVRARFPLSRTAAAYVRIYENRRRASWADMPARARARLRLSPIINWRGYLDERWGVGSLQYQVSLQLAQTGEWPLAAAAARASLLTSPTMFARRRRMAHLFRTHFSQRLLDR